MFRDYTVFVVGAGASAEFSMPVGSQLSDTIRDNCKFNIDYGRIAGGVGPIMHHLQKGVNMQDHAQVDALNARLQVMRNISQGIEMAESIDEFIYRYSDNALVAEIGKLQIAWAIANAEASSILSPQRKFDAKDGFQIANTTWLSTFAKALLNGVKAADIEKIGENITIVCFNYDRCIEHYLEHAIVRAYPGTTDDKAREIVGNINIIHPYGSLGLLRTFPFGTTNLFANMANNLITWSETIKDAQITEGIKTAMQQAERVVFLGFAFARQNMELLEGDTTEARSEIVAYSTGFGLPKEAEKSYKASISLLYNSSVDQYVTNNVHIQWQTKCYEFMNMHRYNLVR